MFAHWDKRLTYGDRAYHESLQMSTHLSPYAALVYVPICEHLETDSSIGRVNHMENTQVKPVVRQAVNVKPVNGATPTIEQLMARILELEAQQHNGPALSVKVSEKGAIQV